MSNSDIIKEGYWSIATQKHLNGYTSSSPNLDEIDDLNIAGQAGRFLGVVRGNSVIENIKKIEKMAGHIGISRSSLHRVVLPEIEKASDKQVELIRDTDGQITGVAEYLFSNEKVLEIAGQVFENQNPSDIERIAVHAMDETKKVPYLQSELQNILNKNGYREKDINLSLAIQNQFKLIQKLSLTKGKEPIFSNEYVWGVNHKKIAAAISSLNFREKQNLRDIIEIIQNTQGVPFESLPPIDLSILELAKKVGMITPATIVTSRDFQKDFAFSPNLLEPLTYKDDLLDDVKLLLASIRFGENYTQHTTITDPAKFLEYLINYGEIGPHDANGTDYTLLEKKGIVRVVQKKKYNSYTGRTRFGYCLELKRKDVAREALKIIKSPEYNISVDQNYNYSGMLQTGKFISAEEMRMRMGAMPEPIQEAEEHLNRVLRDELI